MSRKHIKEIVLACIILLLILLMLYSGLQILESTVLIREQDLEETQPSKTVTSGGIDYFPRQDITTLLIMGIDETGPVKDSMSYNNEGESDVVLIVVFDDKEKTYNVLALNRDTMVEMPILGLGGKRAGTKTAQLALAHTYGSGLHDSCENVKDTVSELLGGDFIDYYLAMNMDAIPILNDAVGGVSVTVTDDFSEVDSGIHIGEMTLHGQQALSFVQIRKNVGTQMNVSRMERQKEYMQGFVEALNAKLEINTSFVLDAYETVSPYIVTDCTVNTLNLLADHFNDYQMGEVITPAGENIKGDIYMEFYLDPDEFEELRLQLFYSPK